MASNAAIAIRAIDQNAKKALILPGREIFSSDGFFAILRKLYSLAPLQANSERQLYLDIVIQSFFVDLSKTGM